MKLFWKIDTSNSSGGISGGGMGMQMPPQLEAHACQNPLAPAVIMVIELIWPTSCISYSMSLIKETPKLQKHD